MDVPMSDVNGCQIDSAAMLDWGGRGGVGGGRYFCSVMPQFSHKSEVMTGN